MTKKVRSGRAARRSGRGEHQGDDTRARQPRPPGARYVYGIARASAHERLSCVGLGGKPAPVRLVKHRSLAAIVSDFAAGPLEPTRENVLAHERVNETALKHATLLPVAFGTVFADDTDVVDFLRGGYDAFRRALLRVEGHVEYGVKVVCDRDQMIRVLEREDADLRRLRQELSTQNGASYFARVQYGRLVERALQRGAERAAGHTVARLRDAASDIAVERPLGDRVVVSLAALVPRAKESVFHARLGQLAAELDRMVVRCTGPWPPYSFVHLRIRVGAEPERAGR